jgi:V8-like Glu-specific endopeptidase
MRGEAQPVDEYRARKGGIFHTNDSKYMDYSIVELEGQPGNKWGWLPLQVRTIERGERVNIIQHAGGRPKQVALQNNFVEYFGGNVIQYVTSTLPGSSGSPVFNDSWEVVALHHAGDERLREPTTQRTYFRNEGILIAKILADLPSAIQQKISAAVTMLSSTQKSTT